MARPPFLSWKGLQWWSVGRRVPALCKMFVKAKTTSKLTMVANILRKSKRTSKATTAAPASPATFSKTTEKPYCAGPSSSLSSSSGTPAVVAAPPFRLSGASSSYERFSSCKIEEYDDLPRVLTLGRTSSAKAAPTCLQREGSARRHSRADGEATGSAMEAHPRVSRQLGSPAAMAMSRLVKETRLASDLFAGNQFLTHVTAAPVVLGEDHDEVRPSIGLHHQQHHHHHHLHLKDRIIFFL